jgi:bifunctional lysine-specific demethylase and histidyl-hydroxylase NO66
VTQWTGGAALRRCIACSVETFATSHWGRAPLLSTAAELGGTFSDLLDATAVDELVSRRGLRTPFLRMAKDGAVLAPKTFTRGGGVGATINDQVADDRVLRQLDDGATLVLQALHRTWPPLVDFASELSSALGHPVQINSYITPAQNRGFAPHYDVHDVFVLQIEGRKRWRIHAPVVLDPLENQPWEQHRDAVAARAQEEPLLDCVLAPGDALYLPRGTIHAADALGETSIHLTVGVHPVTRYQLVRQLLELVQDEPALRASLPLGVDLSDPDVLAPQLAETVQALIDRIAATGADRIAERIGDRLMDLTRPEPIGPLAQLRAADALDADTVLRLRSGLRQRWAEDTEQISLTVLGRTVVLAAGTAPALKTMLAGDPFRPRDLPGLDAEEQLTLARQLLREGVIVCG